MSDFAKDLLKLMEAYDKAKKLYLAEFGNLEGFDEMARKALFSGTS